MYQWIIFLSRKRGEEDVDTEWYLENQIRQRDELERRVKRLELILLQDAKNKIASLKDEEAGTNKKVLSDQGKIVTDIFYADGEEY